MAKKEVGGRSSQQNDFLVEKPLAPINVVATNVGTNRAFDNGSASVSFELPVGSSAAISFTVTATAAGETTRTATGATSPIIVETLKSAITYTISVTATNLGGTSDASVTTTVAVTTVPATPAAPAATPLVNQDSVSWLAPATGGPAITLYYWESDDAKSGNTASTSVTVTQEGSTSQAYRVRAENANGLGEWSPYSGTITTTPPFFPPFFPFFPPFFPFFPPFFPFFPPFFPFFPPRFPFFPPFFPFFPFFPPRFPFFPPRFRVRSV